MEMRTIILLLLLFAGFFARAQGILSSEIPDHFNQPSAGVVQRTLGHSCSTVQNVDFILPCNPAFIESDQDRFFTAGLYIGSEYETLDNINDIINGPHDEALIQDLFAEKQVIQAEASGDLVYRHRWLGASITPLRATYFSVVRNQTYPVVAIHAMKEQTIRVMTGTEVDKNHRLGIQLRAVKREFVQDEFTLFEAITAPESVLERKEQNAFYAEPGYVYTWKELSWEPRVAFLLGNIGVVSQRYEEVDATPILDSGFGLAPPVGYGELEANSTWP
jgi:hypothetical protein